MAASTDSRRTRRVIAEKLPKSAALHFARGQVLKRARVPEAASERDGKHRRFSEQLRAARAGPAVEIVPDRDVG